jgi:hypothetical protein
MGRITGAPRARRRRRTRSHEIVGGKHPRFVASWVMRRPTRTGEQESRSGLARCGDQRSRPRQSGRGFIRTDASPLATAGLASRASRCADDGGACDASRRVESAFAVGRRGSAGRVLRGRAAAPGGVAFGRSRQGRPRGGCAAGLSRQAGIHEARSSEAVALRLKSSGRGA